MDRADELQAICEEVEAKWEMGGLSSDGGLYSDYAKEVARRFAALVRAQVIEEAATLMELDWPADAREEKDVRAMYAAAIRSMKSNSVHPATAVAEASTAPLPDRPFAIVIGRGYDGDDSLELAVHDGVNYCMSDGDCFDRDGDTLDGYTAEFLTQYELEQRLDAAHRRSVAGDQKPNVQESPSLVEDQPGGRT